LYIYTENVCVRLTERTNSLKLFYDFTRNSVIKIIDCSNKDTVDGQHAFTMVLKFGDTANI